MSLQILVTIVLGLLPFITAFAAFRLSSRQLITQAKATAKAVDAEAYGRAQKIYESAIDQLNEEASRVRIERDRLRDERAGLRDERDRLRRELGAIREERDRLHEINNQLESEVGMLSRYRDEAGTLRAERDRLHETNQKLQAELVAIRRNGTGPGP